MYYGLWEYDGPTGIDGVIVCAKDVCDKNMVRYYKKVSTYGEEEDRTEMCKGVSDGGDDYREKLEKKKKKKIAKRKKKDDDDKKTEEEGGDRKKVKFEEQGQN